MKNIFVRLAEERKRLGLNKGQMAKAGNVANSTYANYEDGSRSPDGEFFAAIAEAGADVLYILTGVRSAAAPVLGVEQQQAGYSVEVLDKQEQALLDNFRHCPQEGKQQLESASALYAKLSKKRA